VLCNETNQVHRGITKHTGIGKKKKKRKETEKKKKKKKGQKNKKTDKVVSARGHTRKQPLF